MPKVNTHQRLPGIVELLEGESSSAATWHTGRHGNRLPRLEVGGFYLGPSLLEELPSGERNSDKGDKLEPCVLAHPGDTPLPSTREAP
jgi:hypothetical protein